MRLVTSCVRLSCDDELLSNNRYSEVVFEAPEEPVIVLPSPRNKPFQWRKDEPEHRQLDQSPLSMSLTRSFANSIMAISPCS